MLSQISLLLAVSLGVALGDAIASQPNFIVDWTEIGTDWAQFYPYPMDICLQTGFLSYEYVKYTCLNDNSGVVRTVYEESDCTTEKETRTITSADTKDNGAYAFNCGGITSYAKLFACIDYKSNENEDECGECIVSAEAYWAVDICHYGGDGNSSQVMETKCDGNEVTVNTFAEQEYTEGCFIVTDSIDSIANNCTFFGKLNSPAGKLFAYAYMQSCVIDGVELVEQPTNSGDDDNNNNGDSDTDNSGTSDSDSDGDGDDDGTNGGSTVVDTGGSSSSSGENEGLGGDNGNNNSDSNGSTKNTLLIVAICLIGALILFAIVYYVRRKRKTQANANRVDYGIRVREVSMDNELVTVTNGNNKYMHDTAAPAHPVEPSADGVGGAGAGVTGTIDAELDDLEESIDNNNNDGNDKNNGQNNEDNIEVAVAARPQETNDGNSAMVGEN